MELRFILVIIAREKKSLIKIIGDWSIEIHWNNQIGMGAIKFHI